MIKEILHSYNEDILNEVLSRYGIDKNNTKSLGALESFVYEYKINKRSYILKITHSLRRSAEYIKGEIDWLNYLANNGVSAARAFPSKNGNLVEIIDGEMPYFIAISYEKADGKLVTEDEWHSNLFSKWGQVIGKMHKLTKKYKIKDISYKRQEWYEDDLLNVEKYLSLSQTKVIDKTLKLIERLKSLPKDKESYGLIHADLHHENFFIHNKEITVFDFDDIQYDWFINDIAIALYYAIWWNPLKNYDKNEFAKSFLKNFLEGYNKENTLDTYWIDKIPYFLKLRHIMVYIIFHQIFDLSNLTKEQDELINKYRYEIENEIPIVDINFSSI